MPKRKEGLCRMQIPEKLLALMVEKPNRLTFCWVSYVYTLIVL